MKTKIIFLLILGLLVTACGARGGDSDTEPTLVADAACNLQVGIADVDEAAPGETIYTALEKTGFGWEYRWSSTPADILSNSDLSSTSFIMPDNEDMVTISVEVTDSKGCTAQDTIEINLVTLPTPSPSATSTPQPTETPTPTASRPPTATSTPLPTDTMTPTPTNTPVTLPPTQPPLAAPVITDYEILPGGDALILAWEWAGALAPDQHFAVRFWSKDDPRPEARYSITWTTAHSYEFSIAGFSPGEYLMNVAIMRGPSNGEHYEIIRSMDVQVYVPPIATPVPEP